jgi:hypothetical protein
VADAKIKSGLAAHAVRTGSTGYNPLYARAFQMPQPWGVTTLFAEHTGNHPPIAISWALEPYSSAVETIPRLQFDETVVSAPVRSLDELPPTAAAPPPQPAATPPTSVAFGSFWDLALAINRSEPIALEIAQNGANPSVTVDPADLRKLLGTVWFRSVFPRLSTAWRERLLTVLADSVLLPNHVLKLGRRDIRMRDVSLPELKELFSKSSVSEAVRADVRLLMAIGNLWGSESFGRLQFADDAAEPASKLTLMMQGLRR